MNLALLLPFFVHFLFVLFPFSNFVAPYSITDLAKDMFVVWLHNLEQCCEIRLRKPMLKMAFCVLLLMCVLHGIHLKQCCEIRLRKLMVKMAFWVMLLMCVLHGICIARGMNWPLLVLMYAHLPVAGNKIPMDLSAISCGRRGCLFLFLDS